MFFALILFVFIYLVVYFVVALFVVGVGGGGIFYALIVSLLSTLFIQVLGSNIF